MDIVVQPARDDECATVENLCAFYIYDLSEFGGWDVEEDGRFGPADAIGNYWGTASGTPWHPEWQGFPNLIRVDGRIAGFALVKRIALDTFDMGEFFVLRKYRRGGVGEFAARTLFDRHRGRWEVRQLLVNLPAQRFWQRIIGRYTNDKFTDGREMFDEYGMEFTVQRFVTRT
jgi:predicted acetyltransferase